MEHFGQLLTVPWPPPEATLLDLEILQSILIHLFWDPIILELKLAQETRQYATSLKP